MARFEVPEGWTAQAYRFALDPTPKQLRALASHAGAARFAHNHMLALVKAVMDQRAAERSYGIPEDQLTPVLGWSLPALRKTWNQRKATCAPWWAENSKEAYNTGLDGWPAAWTPGRRRAAASARAGSGLPRFKSARTPSSAIHHRVIRVEADRRHVTLPRLGRSAPMNRPASWLAASKPERRGSCRLPCARTAPGAGTARCRPSSKPRPGPPTHDGRCIRWSVLMSG